MWLGESDSVSSEAISILNRAGSGTKCENVYRRLFRGSYINASCAIYALCHREYWTRLWIVQEVILASEIVIQCGIDEFGWDYLESLIWYIDTFLPASYDQMAALTRSLKECALAKLVRRRRSTMRIIGNNFENHLTSISGS